jgi:hypothetical protein
VTNVWLTMALWPVRPLGRQGGEADRGSKSAKGEVRLAKGSPFHPTDPGLVRCNDFKDASKVAASSSPRSDRSLQAEVTKAVTDTLAALCNRWDALGPVMWRAK